MDTTKNINSTLDSSLVSDELINITTELTEVSIDSLLQDGILKDIPIIGTLIGLTRIGVSVRDKLFLKKVLLFLYQLKDIPGEKRQSFIEKINSENKFKTKVGESIMLLVDKINDYSKADYLGKLFGATIEGKIDYATFLKLANVIDKCYIPDLDNLIPIYQENSKVVDDTDKDILYNLGLLKNLGVDGQVYMYRSDEKIPNKKNQLEINKYGRLIFELLLQK